MNNRPELALSASLQCLEFVVCSAATLARQEQSELALELLSVPNHAATAKVFDLRARIYAQQGRYKAAEAQWRLAIERDPSNSQYQECLREAERPSFRSALFRLRPLIGGFLLLVAVVAGSIAIWRETRTQSRAISVSSEAYVVSADTKATSIEIRFPFPLFSSGIKLTPEGRNELRQIANDLRSVSRIEIFGLTDAKPLKANSKYRDNEQLGMSRAYAVAVLMHKELGLPLTQITLSSGKPSSRVDPTVGNSGQRTVIIRAWSGGS
jgi:flagellar motor protein MotB